MNIYDTVCYIEAIIFVDKRMQNSSREKQPQLNP